LQVRVAGLQGIGTQRLGLDAQPLERVFVEWGRVQAATEWLCAVFETPVQWIGETIGSE
jgi:hypothetical protein